MLSKKEVEISLSKNTLGVLTMDEKVDLVREYRYEYGFNRCCEALALSKGTWHYRMKL